MRLPKMVDGDRDIERLLPISANRELGCAVWAVVRCRTVYASSWS